MSDQKKRVLSCIQPTGQMHYGNYFGAVKNWINLQENYNCFFGVVDYHAITMPYQPKKLRENTWSLIFNLLSCGIKAENLFIQSLVPEHTELAWILASQASYGQLTRMTQFKDKSQQSKSVSSDGFISTALFSYPILQAADILIYQADFVPVGQDQQQHLELTRNIAERFNAQFKKEFFTLPDPLFSNTPKILSTADPSRKMSKSAGEKHYIDVFAEESRIRKQIRSAVTDTGTESNEEMSPGVFNLFQLIKACGNLLDAHDTLMEKYEAGKLEYSELKAVVADQLVILSQELKEKRNQILENKKEVKNQIKQSSLEIRKVARQTLQDCKEIIGVLNTKN